VIPGPTLPDRLRYRFDNIMARGVPAQIGLLSAVTAVIIVLGAIAVVLTGVTQKGTSLPSMLWTSLLHVVDNGNISNDGGNGWYVFVMLLVTLGGLTILAALFGIVTNGIDEQMQALRRGRSRVLERNHTLILGWSPQIFQIISELTIANENQRRACVVVLSERDKPEMEGELRERVPSRGGTRIVCRTGNPLDLSDLPIGNPAGARSIIILPPDSGDPDTHVIKTLLALTHHPQRRAEPYHIVAPIRDPRNLEVAEMAGRGEAVLVLGEDLISRITVQTCRQSGLSVVYTELLQYEGDELYFQVEPALVGRCFGDALLAYDDSSPIGMRRADGTVLINPPMETVIARDDAIIAISADDDTVKLSGRSDVGIEKDAIRTRPTPPPAPEQTLVINWNSRTPAILRELDNYVAQGSRVTLAVRDSETIAGAVADGAYANLHIEVVAGDPTDRRMLDALHVAQYDHVIVLGESDTLDAQEADARTLTTLLHLRSIQERESVDFAVVSEMVDLRNRELAAATRADDFIVSDQLVSLMLSQLSETRALQPVFDDLFDPEGSEIYLKPIDHYVELDRAVNFYTVVEAARRCNEVAIGYRIAAEAENAANDYGVLLNPPKSNRVTYREGDRVIVVAEE
jgi:voltage-gated potassium channel Kch